MDNIFDLFNDRKAGIDALCEINESDNSSAFSSLEEAVNYMDELIYEATNDFMEFKSVCYMEDLVLEQMMYENFNEDEMEQTLEATMNERFSNLGERLSGLWEKIQAWFTSVINTISDYVSSNNKIIEKYGKANIMNALKSCGVKVRATIYASPGEIGQFVRGIVNKINSSLPESQEDVFNIIGLGSDEKTVLDNLKKKIVKSENPVEVEIKNMKAEDIIAFVEKFGEFSKALKEMGNGSQKLHQKAMSYVKNKMDARKNDETAVYMFAVKMRQKIINFAINCVRKACMQSRAMIIKAMSKSGAIEESVMFEDFDEYLEEGIKDTIITARDKAKGKLNNMKENHKDKKAPGAIAKKERQIEQIRAKIEKVKAGLEKEKQFAAEFEEEANEDIAQLMDEIRALRERISEKQAVAQESLFSDDEEIEALEESLKEKVGELGNKIRQKFYDLAAKTYKKPEKIQAAIDKAEKENAEMSAELEKREINGEKFRAKLGRFAWYSLLGNLDPYFGPNVKPTKVVRNAVKLNNAWISALNKRKSELEAKSEPAQESLSNDFFDITYFE